MAAHALNEAQTPELEFEVRVFAQARIVNAPQRQSMTRETFSREVFLRSNTEVLLRLISQKYDSLL